MNRRDFLFATAGTVSALDMLASVNPGFARQFEKQMNRLENLSADSVTEDEDFWGWVRGNYSLSTNIINLNNGGVSPQPKIVQEAHIRNYQLCNEAPSYYMWRILD